MESYNFNNLRVLAVDDSPFMIRIIVTLLNAMDIRDVQGLCCPTEIFDAIKERRPDLIITDHIMEPITGLEMIKQIRNDEDSPDRFIPVILLTGHAKADVVKSARFNSGADAVLVKPVSAQRLHEAIVAIYKSDRTFVEAMNYFGPDRRVKDRPFEGPDRRGDDDGRDSDDAGSYDGEELVFVDTPADRKDAPSVAAGQGRS